MIIRFGTIVTVLFLQFFFIIHTSFGQNSSGQIKCICIDAGHGGVWKQKDPGDSGALGANSQEKNITLSVALAVGKLIKENYPDIKVVYTRTTDVRVDLIRRSKIANEHKADLFISIHANAVDDKRVHGIETYVLGFKGSSHNLSVAMKENSVIKYEKDHSVNYAGFDPNRPESYVIFQLLQNFHLKKSLELASAIQEELVKNTGRRNRGVGQEPFWVLKDAAMPAVLVEMGFISNLDEERYMNSKAGQSKLAYSVFKGFERYKKSVESNSALLSDKAEPAAPQKRTEEQKEIPGRSDRFFYAIQVASATSKISNTSKLCSGEKVDEFYKDGRYRYYVAPADNFNDAQRNMNKVRSKVKDCFIIAVHNGNLIPIPEARKLEKIIEKL